MNGRLKQPLIHTTPNKSTGHPESGRAALDVKAKKKKSEPGGSQIKDLLDATEERKTRNPERSQSERRENKNNNSSFQIQLQLIIELKILFYFSPLLHEYSKSPHSGCLRVQKDDTLPACVLRIRCLTLRLSKILKKSSTVVPRPCGFEPTRCLDVSKK